MSQSVDELRESLETQAEILANEYEPDDELPDEIFRAVDNWFQSELGTGSISNMPSYPSNDYEFEMLRTACNMLELAESDAWITTDSGLWEGMDGQQIIFAQAFHSMENVLREYLPDDLE